MFSRRAGYKDSTIVSSPASVTLSVFIDAFIDAAVLSGRRTCLDSGFPGAPGQVGDFLSFYLSNIVRFVFQDCFVFMPCQVIMRKKSPRAGYANVASSSTFVLSCTFGICLQPFSIDSERNVCLVEALDPCPCYGSCELPA